MREQPLARTHTACTKLHGPLQSSPAPIPGMQRPPRARIALNGGHSPPEAAQGVEARRHEKRCHEASDIISCTRERWQACERSARRQARQRRAHGHAVVLTSAPHRGQPPRQLQVEEELAVLPPVVSATPRPPQLQARGSSAGTRHFRRARSARAIGRPRRHLDAFVLLRSAELCKFVGGASTRWIGHLLGLMGGHLFQR